MPIRPRRRALAPSNPVMTNARARWPALGLAALALSACPPHEDVTPAIEVRPGAAARAAWVRGGLADSGVKAAPARVHPMAAGEELGGPNAVGRPGDLVLENEEVVFVFDRLGSSYGFAESGGSIVDAADARLRKDELGQVMADLGKFPRQCVHEELSSGASPDGAAWVEAKGHDLLESKILCATRSTLRPGDRALLMETTVTNQSGAEQKLVLGDAIQWGATEKFAPDRGASFKGASSSPYIAGIGRLGSYAITSTEGAIAATSGGGWTDTEQRTVALAPGQKAEYARVLLVGQRPDLASVVSELTRASGGEVGAISVALEDGAGKPLRAPAGSKLVVGADANHPVLTLRTAQDADTIEGELPPGKWYVGFVSGGGRGPGASGAGAELVVKAGEVARAKLTAGDAGAVRVTCTEAGAPIPCKLTFERAEGAAPDFGPAWAAGPAKNQMTSATGTIEHAIAPGKWHIVASRGPEYAIDAFDLEVKPNETAAHESKLARVVDTRGYVAADFHQHSMLGADAPTSREDRVISNVAEGVEIAVASEHNLVADLAPWVRKLGMEAHLVSLAGDEISSDASHKPWGHANVFPLAIDPAKDRGGAPAARDRTAKEIFAELRARKLDPAPVIQINHPRTGSMAYFDKLGFDRATGTSQDPGYDPVFDAVEVWNGRNAANRDAVLEDFFALLRTSHPVTPTADTDTHGLVAQEAGYPRTYVAVSDDGHLAAWDASRTADLARAVRERRDVVLTNGPFLRVSANGAGIGKIARASRGAVNLEVTVECAPWMKVDELVVRRANGPELKQAITLKPTPGGATSARVVASLPIKGDDAFVVIVRGTQPLRPVLSGDVLPFAMTGAIWVDADGDRKSLGRSE